jgi:hypothetical protein
MATRESKHRPHLPPSTHPAFNQFDRRIFSAQQPEPCYPNVWAMHPKHLKGLQVDLNRISGKVQLIQNSGE